MRREHHGWETSNQQLLQNLYTRGTFSRESIWGRRWYAGEVLHLQNERDYGTACLRWSVSERVGEGKLDEIWSGEKSGLQHPLVIALFLRLTLFVRLPMTPPYYRVCMCMSVVCTQVNVRGVQEWHRDRQRQVDRHREQNWESSFCQMEGDAIRHWPS